MVSKNKDICANSWIEPIFSIFAGGLAGAIGSTATSPLEVVKTRLQSSVATFHSSNLVCGGSGGSLVYRPGDVSIRLHQNLRYIILNEGFKGLYKGLTPTLYGVIPSRAIYFYVYENSKLMIDHDLLPNDTCVNAISAFNAGFFASTFTNPIWMIKTRMQLNQKSGHLDARTCAMKILREDGVRGFWRGVTASYYGIAETVIHLVIYEDIKTRFNINCNNNQELTKETFLGFVLAACTSKSIATLLAYPHEVARTRMRQEGTKYVKFWHTLFLVAKEEGFRGGLYRGLCTQLFRQIPNTAIVMSTYELIKYHSHRWL